MHFLSPRSAHRREAGFSLVELIVVVAILGILVIVAIPVYGAIQATAAQNSVSVAANNAFTGVTEAYATGEDIAANTYVRDLNAKNDKIQIQVQNHPAVPFEGEDAKRALLERWRHTDDNADPDSPFGPQLGSMNVMNEDNQYITSPGYSAGNFCVVAFDIRSFPVKTMGFAGSACGPAGDPSKW